MPLGDVYSPGMSAAETAIEVKPNALARLGEYLSARGAGGARVVLITDEVVGGHYGGAALSALRGGGFAAEQFRIAPGEVSKSLAITETVYRFLAGQRFGRDGVIVALGGGVVSDLAGFVAGTWMRGVRWIVCPTTLEAQIDASIGGKTAVNVPGGKNLVGVFHPPMLVVVDPNCLATLPRRELVAGLAESVKHALITSEEFFAWHEQNVEKILALDSAVMTLLIERNIATKTAIVARDPQELTGERFVLNFGHTVGHAIEECSLNPTTADTAVAHGPHSGPLPRREGNAPSPLTPLPRGEGERFRHGECVAIGMVVACRLSHRRGMLDAVVVTRVESLLSRFGLPTRVPEGMDVKQLLQVMQLDKKARGGKVKFVLLEGIGKPVVVGDVTTADVQAALGGSG